jgi:DNA-binding transcriptional LysR family regulator
MQDLNDLYLFAEVVRHKGFSPAARAIGEPKSKLSKHVARLEKRLGARLIERSTRSFRVTDVGHDFYQQCEAVLASAMAAEAVVARARSEPQGTVRVSCPHGLAHGVLAMIVPPFLARHPLVQLEIKVLNRPVDLIEERIDVALRVRTRLDTDANLMVRILGHDRAILVASPSFVAEHGPVLSIEAIQALPTLTFNERVAEDAWDMTDQNGRKQRVAHRPRLACGDFNVLRQAAIVGLGIALLPEDVCAGPLGNGTLAQVLPDWGMSQGIVHLVFTTREGLLPAVRAFIDHVAAEFPPAVEKCRAHGFSMNG